MPRSLPHGRSCSQGLSNSFLCYLAARLSIAVAVFFLAGGASYAQCTPQGMARYYALNAQITAAANRAKAGDCSAVARWKSLVAAKHAILRRSQQQTYPYTCNVSIEYPAPPSCGGGARTAQTTKQKAAPPASAPVAETKETTTSSSGSCSDITGVGGGPGPSNYSTPGGVKKAQTTEAQSYMQAAKTLKQSDTSYNGWNVAAAQFRKAAAAFKAAGDLAQADAATEQATTLEDALKMADEKAKQQSSQSSLDTAPRPSESQLASNSSPASQAAPTDLCEVLHGNADKCYRGAIAIGPGGGPIPESGQAGAFLSCVRINCSAMAQAKCAMPIFGTKRSLGYCLTLASEDPDFVKQRDAACPVGKHLF